jgi:hypothetical protein
MIAGLLALALLSSAAASAVAPADTAVTVFAGSTATGRRTATLTFSGGGPACKLETVSFDAPAVAPPPGVAFRDGLFEFATSGCIRGSTLRFTLIFATALPPDARYWKYGRTSDNRSPHWYELPVVIDGSTATFSIRDGGLGDDDLTVNGLIAGSGGLGVIAMRTLLAPEGLVASAGNGYVSLRWSAVPFATGYTIKRATKTGGPYEAVSINHADTLFTDNNRTNGTTYYYTVSARNGQGESSDAAEVHVAPIEH